MKLGLGTAQFGLDYGVSNRGGRTPRPEVARVLADAHAAGIRVLDTAAAYGDAQAVLGEVGVNDFDVVTKVPPGTVASGIVASAEKSLGLLGVERCYGLLVHALSDIFADDPYAFAAQLEEVRDSGLAEKVGVSAYTGAQLAAVLDVFKPDIVQVPVSVFDQRLLRDGTLESLHARGIEVHVRSTFLQGLLLMDPQDAPAYFEPIRGHLIAWRAFCADKGLSPLSAALGFVTGLEAVDKAIVGVESSAQLAEILMAAAPLHSADFAELGIEDAAFLDPSRWHTAP